MKIQPSLTLFFTAFLFLSLKCKKQTTNTEPQLPPETTTGAMTFGCKIDGKVFLPRDGNGLSGLRTEYLFLGNGLGGGWYLNIVGTNRSIGEMPAISITTDSLLLIEGNTYQLQKQKGHANGEHFLGLFTYKIVLPDSGTLIITKHNQTERILSGRFSFTATNQNGTKVNVTDGRFDIRY